MNLIEELRAIRDSIPRETNYIEPLFWRLLDVAFEMAKRIEGLEQREYGHTRRVGILQDSMGDDQS